MRVTVKICGLCDAAAVDAAVEAGADAVGFVLAEHSPRALTLAAAARLAARVPSGVRRIAVLGRDPDAALLAQLRALPFDAVQLYEPSALGAAQLAPLELLPAVADGPGLLRRALAAQGRSGRATAIVVDGPGGGGRGRAGDHRRIAAVAWRVPIVLAGGLDPDNVGAAVAHVRPVGVDVSSGVERRPGVKDGARIRAFVAAARAAASGLREGAA